MSASDRDKAPELVPDLPVPDLLVEQLALGELDEAAAASVRARLGDQADACVDALRRSDRETLEANPPDRVARRIKQRLAALDESPEETGVRWGLWVGGFAALAAAGVLAWLVSDPQSALPSPEPAARVAVADSSPDSVGDVVRLKGDAAIVLRRQDGARSEVLAPGADVSEGDAILVSYRAATATHGVLVSLDGAGEATLHFPADAADPTALKTSGVVALHTFDLDDAPGFERFFFVTGAQPIDVASVMTAVRELGRDPSAGTAPLKLQEPAVSITDFPLNRRPK